MNNKRKLLTKREQEVADLIFIGNSNQEIADALKIKLATVKFYAHEIFKKYGVKTRNKLTYEMSKEPIEDEDFPPAA